LPLSVSDPHEGDDATAASITGVTDAVVLALNTHMAGGATNGADQHADSHILMTTLDESHTPVQNPSTQHIFNDMMMKAWSTLLGSIGGSNAAGRIAAIGTNTYQWVIATLQGHAHSGALDGGKLLQANTHQSADTDAATTSLHHTLGTGANQAAAGNHTHAAMELTTNKNANNGYAGLDANGLLTVTQIPHLLTRAYLADGLVAAQASPDKTVRLTASYTYYNTSGVQKTVSGTTEAIDAVNALPSGSNLRVDMLYADDAGAMHWLAGTPALSSPTDPPKATNTYPLAYVGPIASTTTAITAGMIRDARPSPTAGNNNGSGGGGGGGPDLSAMHFITIGGETTLTQETDLFGLMGGTYFGTTGTVINTKDLGADFFVYPPLVKKSKTSASTLDVLNNSVSPNIIGKIINGAAVGSIGINASANDPVEIVVGGEGRKITTPTYTAAIPTSSASGAYNVIGDPTVAGRSDFTISLSQSGAPAGQMVLAQVIWDNQAQTFQLGPGSTNSLVYFPLLPVVNGAAYRPEVMFQQDYTITANAMTGNSYSGTIMPGATPVQVVIPTDQMRGEIWLLAYIQQTGTANVDFYIGLQMTKSQSNPIAAGTAMVKSVHATLNVLGNTTTMGSAIGTYFPYLMRYEVTGLSAGIYTIQPSYMNGAASGNAVNAGNVVSMWGNFTR
jgi:hypothetical protein